MNCWNCQTELIWGGDHDIEDDEYSMVTNLSCPNCDCYFEVYYPKEDNEKKTST
tara:strand:+ start:1136 stop:1297 length:162 start_codon:yes stop_codon:yes gene_type:complete